MAHGAHGAHILARPWRLLGAQILHHALREGVGVFEGDAAEQLGAR